ncbi:MAG: TIGR01777 family oxidoreductase [Phycisphaerales bacterium]|nr:TIGR01777 family oxidoreductase [Phycisphaerales bacterium]
MHIAVSGASGLVGGALVEHLARKGHTVLRLVRADPRAAPGITSPQPGQDRILRPPDEGRIPWQPDAGRLDSTLLEGLDAVVHLAGENIAAGRWTARRKARIRDSRVNGTTLLCGALARCARPPKVLFSASAVGFYGDRGDEWATEEMGAGRGFLADVCAAWESATQAAAQHGIRVVSGRIGMVLSAAGGAMKKMLTPFRLGMGGSVGSGRQWMSWIDLDDLVAAIEFCLRHDALSGPVNLVSPHPVTNLQFTKILGAALHRPTVMPMPAFAARLVFGELADALLLSSLRARPMRLVEHGFEFGYGSLASALEHQLGKRR